MDLPCQAWLARYNLGLGGPLAQLVRAEDS